MEEDVRSSLREEAAAEAEALRKKKKLWEEKLRLEEEVRKGGVKIGGASVRNGRLQ